MRKNMKYKITKATNENTEEILKLYHSLIGKDGCTWDLDYPSKEDIKKENIPKNRHIHKVKEDRIELLNELKKKKKCLNG